MFNVRPLGAFGAVVALFCVAGCGSGAGTTHAASLPNGGVRPNDHANRVVSSRGQQYVNQFSVLRGRPVDQNINEAAAHGARVFRVPTYVVFDPTTNSTFTLPKSNIHETANGIVLDRGNGLVTLSRAAKVSTKPQYTYLFVHGTQQDPDPATGAVRIR